MALEPGRRSVSPESSGRESPVPRQWRNQLGVDEAPIKDKAFRKYASGVDRALALFETALQEWADYISFLNRLLKALQARPPNTPKVPSKALVAKRLSQCLNPLLPSGVHQKALEVYGQVFSAIGKGGLSADLPLYLPGLASTLSFASLSVRSPFLDLLERHFLDLHPRSLRPALKSIILALLPGLEEETAEDFDRTLGLLNKFKAAIRPQGREQLTADHSAGDDFFWQCFFLASVTSQSRRPGALAYLVRYLPQLGDPSTSHIHSAKGSQNGTDSELSSKLSELVTSPEPGLLLRCFAAGLADEQLLIQRGYLDLLVTHLPLHSKVLQSRVKPSDLELLLQAASGVVTRREMSLNRRLWAWFLGPEPPAGDAEGNVDSPTSASDQPHGYFTTKTSYFEEYGLHPLTRALLSMIKAASAAGVAEKAKPYRICQSLMDRWEVGGLVVPEVFLPIVDSVRSFKAVATSKSDFVEVLRSASVFFDGVESGLIYGEILALVARAVGPSDGSPAERSDKLDLVRFILTNFNVREEEMVTIHAPLTALSILAMLEDAKARSQLTEKSPHDTPASLALGVAADLLELVPERAFPAGPAGNAASSATAKLVPGISNGDLLKKIRNFYVNDQGNLDVAAPPFSSQYVAELLLEKAGNLICQSLLDEQAGADLGIKSRVLLLLLSKAPSRTPLDVQRLLACLHDCLEGSPSLKFPTFSSTLAISTHLHHGNRISTIELSQLVKPLVRHAWTFLSASEPKYHVETVRSLWQLQTALTTQNRDVEAAIAGLMLEHDTKGTFAARPADPGRSFAVLWSHTLQDNPYSSDRRTPKTPNADLKGAPRLAGVDHFDVMLTRPLLLILDALLDERTQLFMTVKTWLNSLVGVERLFLILATQFMKLPFLKAPAPDSPSSAVGFSSSDDLDLCLYYVRSLSNIFRWAPDSLWDILARLSISAEDYQPGLADLTGSDVDVPFQEFFLRVCLRCISGETAAEDAQTRVRVMQLNRCALTVVHQILLNPRAEPLSNLHLEDILIDRLSHALDGPDPYIQVLLLDVVFASLKLREIVPADVPASPINEKRAMSLDPTKSLRLSLTNDGPPLMHPPPAALLKCLRAGLSSPSSRSVLDSWVGFLGECLPFYSDSIFQVLIPLVETLCGQIGASFAELQGIFREPGQPPAQSTDAPETTLLSLLNALEQVLAKGHDRLLAEEAKAQTVKSPDQPQSFFGNIFSTEVPQARSATANDRLTVVLAFQDAVRICFTIWSWGQGVDANAQDPTSAASFTHTSLRMRNRARRLLEHLFDAETLECLETVIDIWRNAAVSNDSSKQTGVFRLLPALDGSRPKHTIPAIFNAIYSRTNPGVLDPERKSTLTISLQDTDLVIFLVDYARSLEDDAMDEIWVDCTTFLKDLLANPFPHRQTLPSLLEFAAILGEKVDNTNFGEQRKMRRELGDLFLRLLTALFTTRPMTFADGSAQSEKPRSSDAGRRLPTPQTPSERADDVVGILSSVVPNLPKILVENDRVLTAATAISANMVGPALRSKTFPDTVSRGTLVLLQELSRLPNNQKSWKKDVMEAFNDARFFGSSTALVRSDWLPLLRQWTMSDKERMSEILSRITAPTTAGIVFGVGATSARLEADRKTQLNLRRVATLILASPADSFVIDLPTVVEKLVELLGASATSSPSSTTRAEVYMVVRALVLKTTAVHLAPLWPIVNTELHAAVSSVVAPDDSAPAETYNNASVLQACKLLDLLVCVAPDDFQLHEWLFVTDTVDAVYRPSGVPPVALVDELSEELGAGAAASAPSHAEPSAAASGALRRPLLGSSADAGGVSDDVSLERKDELVAKVLRPFFGQLSIFAFESTYAMGPVDWDVCVRGLLRDLFDERSIVRPL